jgi:hypothetical protein
MPALDSVVFAKTHADGRAPSVVSNGLWTLKFPANVSAGNCLPKTNQTIDLLQTVSIPIGYIGIIAPLNGDNVSGQANLFVNTRVILGTGTPVQLKLQCINLDTVARSIIVNTDAAILAIVKQDEFKTDTSAGTWHP